MVFWRVDNILFFDLVASYSCSDYSSLYFVRKKVKSLSRVQPCDPVDCSPAGSSVHESLQARILEWVAISFSRVSSQPRDRTPGLLHCRQMLYPLSQTT